MKKILNLLFSISFSNVISLSLVSCNENINNKTTSDSQINSLHNKIEANNNFEWSDNTISNNSNESKSLSGNNVVNLTKNSILNALNLNFTEKELIKNIKINNDKNILENNKTENISFQLYDNKTNVEDDLSINMVWENLDPTSSQDVNDIWDVMNETDNIIIAGQNISNDTTNKTTKEIILNKFNLTEKQKQEITINKAILNQSTSNSLTFNIKNDDDEKQITKSLSWKIESEINYDLAYNWFVKDDNQIIWAGSDNGLYESKDDGYTFTNILTKQDLGNKEIEQIYCDDNNNIYILYYYSYGYYSNQGLSVYNSLSKKYQNISFFNDKYISSIFTKNNTVYVSGGSTKDQKSGIYYFENNNNSIENIKTLINNPETFFTNVYCIKIYNNIIYIGADNGLWISSNNLNTVKKITTDNFDENPKVTAINKDQSGNVLFVTENSLYKVNTDNKGIKKLSSYKNEYKYGNPEGLQLLVDNQNRIFVSQTYNRTINVSLDDGKSFKTFDNKESIGNNSIENNENVLLISGFGGWSTEYWNLTDTSFIK